MENQEQGCSKNPSSKAAASEEARRTLSCTLNLRASENEACGLFQQPDEPEEAIYLWMLGKRRAMPAERPGPRS
jgi:hypothetical protein